MNYDKNSFLSGLAVGRTLKGWASTKGDVTNPTAVSTAVSVHAQNIVQTLIAPPMASSELSVVLGE